MHYVTVITPRKICCSYRCAVSQHQCTAALVLAKCSPHCSVLLCKTGSQHALCHCNDTCAALLFIQVCSDPAPMHCSTGFGKMQNPLFSAALQNRCCSLYRCAVTQHHSTVALLRAKCNPHCSVLLRKTGPQQVCVNAITPMEICSLYRCAVTQHQCTATLVLAKCIPHCSVLLCRTGSQQVCVSAITPMEKCFHTGVQ